MKMYFITISGKADYSQSISDYKWIIRLKSPWDVVSNPTLKAIAHIHMSERINHYINLPFKGVWNKYFKIIDFQSDNGICFIINAHYYWMLWNGTIKYIKEKIPNSYVVMFFSDKYDMYHKRYQNFPTAHILLNSFDVVYTYNYEDSNKFGFFLSPPYFVKRANNKVDFKIEESDIFFVGKNKGRLNILLRLYEDCTKSGLKCDFHIIDVPKSAQKYSNQINYKRKISYDEVLERSRRTKCIVNITQEGGQGITLRDYEAFEFDKYLLTDNFYLSMSPLFNKNQIIWFQDGYLNTLIQSVRTPLSPRFLAEKYTEKSFYEWLENKLEEVPK